MFKTLTLFITCFQIFTGLCQAKEEDYKASHHRPGVMWYFDGLFPPSSSDVRKYDRLIFDVTYNDWFGDRKMFQNHWASLGLNANLMFDIPVGKKKKGGFGVGFRYSYVAIRHNAKFLINDNTGTSILMDQDSGDAFVKSSTTAHGFSIPLEIRYRGSNWQHFKIHFGTSIGYQPNLMYRYVTQQQNHSELYLRSGFPDQNTLLYSVYLRVGIRNYALYSSFNMNTVFSKTLSTQLNIVRFGVSISLF